MQRDAIGRYMHSAAVLSPPITTKPTGTWVRDHPNYKSVTFILMLSDNARERESNEERRRRYASKFRKCACQNTAETVRNT